jgi:hypothetical protein
MIYKFGFLILAIAASTFTDAVVDEVALMACVETVDCDVCVNFGDAICAANSACVTTVAFPSYKCECDDGYKKVAMGMCVLEGAEPPPAGDACTPNHCDPTSTCQATADGFQECVCPDASVVRPHYPCNGARNLRGD